MNNEFWTIFKNEIAKKLDARTIANVTVSGKFLRRLVYDEYIRFRNLYNFRKFTLEELKKVTIYLHTDLDAQPLYERYERADGNFYRRKVLNINWWKYGRIKKGADRGNWMIIFKVREE